MKGKPKGKTTAAVCQPDSLLQVQHEWSESYSRIYWGKVACTTWTLHKYRHTKSMLSKQLSSKQSLRESHVKILFQYDGRVPAWKLWNMRGKISLEAQLWWDWLACSLACLFVCSLVCLLVCLQKTTEDQWRLSRSTARDCLSFFTIW